MKSRRNFLKTAGAVAAGVASAGTLGAVACAPNNSADERVDGTASATSPSGTTASDRATPRVKGFDRPLLDALGDVVLPQSIGAESRRAAVTAFVAFVDEYEPVAEEMHGYGYADVRYLPSDPAPAWRAQLAGLDLLAKRSHGKSFAQLDAKVRESVLTAALRDARGDRLPAPLAASHVALALMAHWAATPDAWNLALGMKVSPSSCRTLADAVQAPTPIARASAGATRS